MSRKNRWIAGVLLIALLAVAATWLSASRQNGGKTGLAADRRPERIVALAPSSVEIICALGAGDSLVGVSRFCTYPAAVAEIPRVGGFYDPDLERILSLRPDLVVTRGAGMALQTLCRDNRIATYADPSDTLPDIYRAIREMGDLLHRREEADALSEQLRTELASVAAAVRGQPPVRVLYTTRSPNELKNIYTIGRGPYLNDLIEIAGGQNIFGDLEVAYPEVSVEEIIARAPEVIVEAMPGKQLDAAALDSLMAQWRAVGPIPAVAAGRVYLLTDDFVLYPSPRITILARRLAALFHPQAIADE